MYNSGAGGWARTRFDHQWNEKPTARPISKGSYNVNARPTIPRPRFLSLFHFLEEEAKELASPPSRCPYPCVYFCFFNVLFVRDALRDGDLMQCSASCRGEGGTEKGRPGRRYPSPVWPSHRRSKRPGCHAQAWKSAPSRAQAFRTSWAGGFPRREKQKERKVTPYLGRFRGEQRLLAQSHSADASPDPGPDPPKELMSAGGRRGKNKKPWQLPPKEVPKGLQKLRALSHGKDELIFGGQGGWGCVRR